MNLDLVIRTSERKRDGQSPAQQRQQADAICAQGGHTIAAVHDSAQSESGKTMERAALHAVRERIRAGETDGIVVGYLDRLGRAPIEESMAFVRELVRDGGVLVAADWGADPVDLADPNTEDMLVFRMQMNRSQWNKAAERYRLSQRNAIKAGKHVGPTPLGYVRRKGRLHEHPQLGAVIRETYRRAARDGLHAAVDYLTERVPARTWDTDRARKLLSTRTYLGEARTGELVNAEAHAPLTTLEDWTAAQTTPRRKRAHGDYPLTGIARCACGAGLQGQLQSFANRPQTYRRYRCSNPACRGGSSCSADALETLIRDALKRNLAAPAWIARFVPGDLDAARTELERAEHELDTFVQVVPATSRAFARGYALREQALDAAHASFREVAGQAARSEVLPTPDELDDPAQFARALAVTLDHVLVRRGRGVLLDRIDVAWADALDDGVGALAA